MRYVRTLDGGGGSAGSTPRELLASGRRWSTNILTLVSRWEFFLTLPASLLLTWLLYSPTIRYGFLFDDAAVLSSIETLGYLDILTSSDGFSYYRPVPLLFWKASEQVLGYYHSGFLHLLPVVFHAVAVWLLYVLLRRFGGGVWSILPALLFLTFPFSYQNVMVAGALFLPLSTAAMLGAANLYYVARRASGITSRGIHLLALPSTAVALWSHEFGLVVLLLLAAVEVDLRIQREQDDLSRWLSGHLLLGALFLFTQLPVDRAPAESLIETEGLRLKLLFFLQGLMYPVSAQLLWLEDFLGWAPGILEMAVVLLLASAMFLAIIVWKAWPEWRAFPTSLVLQTIALLIAFAASVPPILFLTWISVEESAYLLYPVGMAAAILWGLLPRIRFERSYVTIVWRGVCGVALALIIIQSLVFIRERQDMFLVASSAVEALSEAGDRHPGDQILVLNAPSRIVQDRYEYPLGQLGVQVIPSTQALHNTISVESRWQTETSTESFTIEPVEAVNSHEIIPHGRSVDEATLDARLRDGAEVVDMRWGGEEYLALDAGRLLPGMAGSRASTATLAGGAIGVTSPRITQGPNGVNIFLSWLVIEALEVDAAVIAGLRSSTGELHLVEGDALAGASPPRLWQAGDRVDDSVYVGNVGPGTYSVVVGVRDRSTDRLLAPGYVTIQQIAIR